MPLGFQKNRARYIFLFGILVCNALLSSCSQNSDVNRGYVISQSQVESEIDELQAEN